MIVGSYARNRVYFTPIVNNDMSIYGDEIDVSDRIEVAGLGTLTRSIDSADFDVGVFTFSDLTLKALNYKGEFNDSSDTRSIFKSVRDRCKVRVVFEKVDVTREGFDGVTDYSVEQKLTFFGLINEEATKSDIEKNEVSFKVLSRDSVLRTTKISSGTVNSGNLSTAAIIAILDQPRITSVLNLDVSNINPDLEVTIDTGTPFNNKTVKEMLDQLMFATNSVLLINDAGDIIVRSRVENTDVPVFNFYGKSDQMARENIIDIKDYNTGQQRMFTSFLLNGLVEAQNAPYAATFGYRQKKVNFAWITNPVTLATIGARLVEEFQTPKIELVLVASKMATRNLNLLDRCSVNFPLRAKPPQGTFLPVIGATVIGDAVMPLPEQYGSLAIAPNIGFKVIEIADEPKSFTSRIKLRQIGKTVSDGVLNAPNNCIVGFSVIGEGRICEGGDPCDTFNPAVVGSAMIGCTEVA